MATTVKEVIERLQKYDPEEVVIGQFFLAVDFEDDEGNLPSKQVMERAETRFWADEITSETFGWLGDIVFEEQERDN
jgi:hypothetical protein